MLTRIIVVSIFIFCFMVVGHVTRSLHCFTNLVVVMWVYVFHCSEGTRLSLR